MTSIDFSLAEIHVLIKAQLASAFVDWKNWGLFAYSTLKLSTVFKQGNMFGF